MLLCGKPSTVALERYVDMALQRTLTMSTIHSSISDANAAIFVHTYGFSIQNSYAIAGGMELQPIAGTIISCEVPDDCVVEGRSVTVTCTRSIDLSEQSRIRVNTEDGSAGAPADYTTLNIPENRPSFFPGNILNYRGGTRQDSAISFDIQTTADGDDTEPPETFFLNVSPVRTAIVLTPRVPITICGATQDIRCPDLTDPANSMVMVAGTTPGDAATYTCNEGYKLDGVSTRTCGPDGQWSPEEPKCLAMCPTPTDPANGMVVAEGNCEGDTATYTCNEGYKLDGVETTTCGPDGQWSSDRPVCLAICHSLSDPPNGTVVAQGNCEGDRAAFICNSGFELVGAAIVICQNDGMWNNPQPVCQSLAVFVSFDPVSYTVTEGVDGAVELILVRSGDLSRATVLTITTADGSAIAGSDYTATTMRVTLIDAVETVARVRVPILDDIVIESIETFLGLLTSSEPNVMIGDGTANVTIVDNDGCPSLPDISNGSVTVSGFATGDMAVYSCDEGYELDGDSTRECLFNSSWSGEAQACRSFAVEVGFNETAITAMESSGRASACLFARSVNPIEVTLTVVTTTTGTATEGVDFQPVFATVYLSINSTTLPCIEVSLITGDGYENPETISLLVTTMNDSVTIVQNMTEITILNSDVAEIVLDSEKMTVMEGDNEVQELCLSLKNSAIDVGVGVPDALSADIELEKVVLLLSANGSSNCIPVKIIATY
ncbi:CUB and sushi domain-containing protein 1, partial [Geodia barretti]